MSKIVVIPNCTVEISLPDVELEQADFGSGNPKVRLIASQHVENVLVKHNGQTLTIKRLWLKSIVGLMQPVVDGENVVYFTTDDRADEPVVVGELR